MERRVQRPHAVRSATLFSGVSQGSQHIESIFHFQGKENMRKVAQQFACDLARGCNGTARTLAPREAGSTTSDGGSKHDVEALGQARVDGPRGMPTRRHRSTRAGRTYHTHDCRNGWISALPESVSSEQQSLPLCRSIRVRIITYMCMSPCLMYRPMFYLLFGILSFFLLFCLIYLNGFH